MMIPAVYKGMLIPFLMRHWPCRRFNDHPTPRYPGRPDVLLKLQGCYAADGIDMDILWIFYGYSMDNLWIIYGYGCHTLW